MATPTARTRQLLGEKPLREAFALALIIMASAVPAVAAALSTQPEELAPDAPPAQPTVPDVLFNLTGYADATFVDAQGDAGSFGEFTLAPIFHLQFGDRVFLEMELEGSVDDNGETEGGVEYATVNWLVTDHVALIAGKFLSPIGYFFQNTHPSWVNKMASAPAGFGHGGAAPLTDVGVQLRGGKTFANGQHINYAVYNGNGPRMGLEEMGEMGEMEETEESEEFELDVEEEGTLDNPDGKRVMGARLGWMPIPSLELGASATHGEVVLDAGAMSEGPEPARRYKVDGLDFTWHPAKTVEVRGEWMRKHVAEASASMIPDEARWRAWYVQAAYRFGGQRWEAVLRHSDSVSPHPEATFRQTAVGINYLFRPSVMLKLDWEFNDSADAGAGADRLLLQFACGF